MKEIEIIPAKLKYKVDDFIVEEIGDKWGAKISEKFDSEKMPDFGNLDLESPKDFLWCEMEKRNIDHFSAIKDVSRILGKNIDAIGYAGTKDKRAWTSQRISIFQPDIEKLKAFRHSKIILKNFKWNKRKIKMGYLEANRFKIVLRDLDKRDAMKIVKHIRGMKWFPNYFGLQRFGSRGNNVKIGRLILKTKFEEAIWAILTDVGTFKGISPAQMASAGADKVSNEQDVVNEARLKLRKEKNFVEAAKYFPPYLKLEKQILYYLARRPGDFVGAIKKSERKNMLMFIHSVQSKIFNDILEIALNEGLDFTKDGQKSCLLVGYKTRFFQGRLGEIEQAVLAKHNLKLEDFNIKEIPYLRVKGSFRKAVTEVEELEVEITDDEEFEGSKKIVLNFVLPSGTYATTFLENFFVFELP